jgi:tetratricopeptide (TPR) repeat protein
MPRPPDPTGTVQAALTHAERLLRDRPALAIEQACEILKVAPGHPAAARLLADAYRTLGDQLTMRGDRAGADAAYSAQIKASTRDPRLTAPAAALCANDIPRAETGLREHLKQYPTDVAAIRMLAEVAARLGRLKDAETLLTRCLELSPSFHPARHNYAIVLHRQNKPAAALVEIERLLGAEPRNPGFLNLRAMVLAKIGETGQALDIYAEVLATHPEQGALWMNYGHALSAAGREEDAIAAYRRGIRLEPESGEAYWSLANLKTFRFTAAERDTMQARLERPDLSDEDRFHFHFAAGKAFEDAQDYAASFEHYAAGNRLRRASLDYDPAETTDFVNRCLATLTADFFRDRTAFGCPAQDPIFIVGLPRAGSTLIEQILSSHSAVEGTMELPDIMAMARRLGERRDRTSPDPDAASTYPERLGRLTGADCRALGQQYLDQTRVQRKTGKPLFIDKMPNNFLHIGLIRLILPNAKIIDARRHPMACCFSAFKQHFARGQVYTYELRELGAYYRDYLRLMAHFDAVLPGAIHRVHYESLIEHTEREVARMLEFCGLAFEERCLRFYDNRRSVRTASAHQVRRPIYREGVDHWRHYEPWLGPLRAALGDACDGG